MVQLEGVDLSPFVMVLLAMVLLLYMYICPCQQVSPPEKGVSGVVFGTDALCFSHNSLCSLLLCILRMRVQINDLICYPFWRAGTHEKNNIMKEISYYE